MSGNVVVVAGGLGDLGKLITEAIQDTGKYEVHVMSRKRPQDASSSVQLRAPIIQTDYSSEEAVAELLVQHNCHTVICALGLDFQAASDAQLTLIRAAERAPCVKRFIPSEFNVDYDLPDHVLPYPDKRFHTAARRALEKTTSLEFTYIYPGMFMDYFGMPSSSVSSTHLRELCLFVDATNGVALLPGDGKTKMAASYTKDVARYTALALGLDKWPLVMTTASSALTLNELVGMVSKRLGRDLDVEYQDVSALQKRMDSRILPRNVAIAEHFPGGVEQLSALLAELGASVALGAYDFSKLKGELNLVEYFSGKTTPPMTIEKLLDIAWGGKKVGSNGEALSVHK
ncbi:hypothetical protein BB8028_0003g14040 [Beauveria bassiana]|uniref:NmrA-like domain-containing protein n=1 Tax=Beauveria bassiana TaxID=176275 RepID=A0A2S7Y9U9_BEABA|nr:hypothetical protein BB8028_0003g14040 [Beauveria bassiana]